MVVPFLCHREAWITRNNRISVSKLRLNLFIVLKLITDASLTFHGSWMWDCTLWVQWRHSLHTDPSAPFCTHAKVISIHPCTYNQNHKSPSNLRHRYLIYVVEIQTYMQVLSLLSAFNTIHSAHVSSDCAKTLFRNTHPSNITYISTYCRCRIRLI